jgi:phosphatidylglycerol:prolipoprotein diacylglycerol transferase
MFPTLFQLGPLVITSLGAFLFLAFLTGAFLIWQKGREENFDPEPLMDSVFLSILAAFFGARILYSVFSWPTNPLWFFNFFKHPGFSYFGGLLGGFLCLLFFCQKQKWDFFKLAEVYIFGLVPAQILVRVGNFLDGSFYGKVSSLPWAIRFPGLDAAVHPLALYEIIFLIFLYWLVKKLERQYRLMAWYKGKRNEAEAGFLFLVYLLGYGVFRFLLEFAAGSSLYLKGLAWEQWLAGVTILASLILFYERTGRNGEEVKGFLSHLFSKLFKKNKEKLEVLKPAYMPGRRFKKRPVAFHIKAGMEAKR